MSCPTEQDSESTFLWVELPVQLVSASPSPWLATFIQTPTAQLAWLGCLLSIVFPLMAILRPQSLLLPISLYTYWNQLSFTLPHTLGWTGIWSNFTFPLLLPSESESIISSVHWCKSCYCLHQVTLSNAIRATVDTDPRDLPILRLPSWATFWQQ